MSTPQTFRRSLTVASSTIDGSDGGGKIILHAGAILLTNEANIRSTNNGDAATLGTDIEVMATEMTILNGAIVVSESQSAGRSGNVRVLADLMAIDGESSEAFTGIANQPNALGNGGNIEITSIDQLTIVNGGKISGSSFGEGDAGSVTVSAGRLLIDDDPGNVGSEFKFTGISGKALGAGAGGRVVVTANEIVMLNNGLISAENTGFSSGDAGSVAVNAERLLLGAGGHIFNRSRGTGDGGAIDVTANELMIVNCGRISGSSSGEGDAGSVTVNADRLFIDRQQSEFFTGISSNADAAGAAGAIDVTANSVSIVNGGQISGNSLGQISSSMGVFAVGAAGSVTINAEQLLIDNQESNFVTGIDTTSVRANPGPVSVNASDILLLGGQIRTSTTSGLIIDDVTFTGASGGPINLSSDVLVLNGGFIQANAFTGQGGNIVIDTDAVVASSNAVLVGGDERKIFQNDGTNVIQAVAPEGVRGLVNINAPDIDVSGSLLGLDPSFVDVTGLAFDACAAFVSGAPSTFTVLGRGGIPDISGINLSFSLTGDLLDELLDEPHQDANLNTFDRLHPNKFSSPNYSTEASNIIAHRATATTCG